MVCLHLTFQLVIELAITERVLYSLELFFKLTLKSNSFRLDESFEFFFRKMFLFDLVLGLELLSLLFEVFLYVFDDFLEKLVTFFFLNVKLVDHLSQLGYFLTNFELEFFRSFFIH